MWSCSLPSRAFLCVVSLLPNLFPLPTKADGVGCPPCDKNASLPAPLGSNLNVCIDGSWDTSPGSGQTVDKVWNATQAAVNSWNSAKGSDGKAAPYTFSLNQQASCDIKIFAAAVQIGAASITEVRVEGGYYELSLPGSTVNHTDTEADLKGIIAHELGHPLGLGNTRAGVDPRVQTCSSVLADSIMDSVLQYPDGKLRRLTKDVQPKDVDAARRKGFNNADCSTIPEDLATGSDVEDVCLVDPCASIDCPDFVPELCGDPLDSYEEIYPDYSDPECWATYLVTDYYWCDGNGCTYLYSTWDFLYVTCYYY